VNKEGESLTISIKGRHDPIIVPRAVVVVESMAALVLVDALLENMGSTLEKLIRHYL
ncbi:MAG: chorismate synthase, partial [Lachnospiraceae bacterium]